MGSGRDIRARHPETSSKHERSVTCSRKATCRAPPIFCHTRKRGTDPHTFRVIPRHSRDAKCLSKSKAAIKRQTTTRECSNHGVSAVPSWFVPEVLGISSEACFNDTIRFLTRWFQCSAKMHICSEKVPDIVKTNYSEVLIYGPHARFLARFLTRCLASVLGTEHTVFAILLGRRNTALQFYWDWTYSFTVLPGRRKAKNEKRKRCVKIQCIE